MNNFTTVFALLALALVLFCPACTVLYKKTKLYQEMNKELVELKKVNRNFEKSVNENSDNTPVCDSLRIANQQLNQENLNYLAQLDSLQKNAWDTAAIEEDIKTVLLDSIMGYHQNKSCKIAFGDATYDVYIVGDSKDINLYWLNKNKPIRSLEKLGTIVKEQKKELIFAMNAGMYTAARSPKGLYIENGKTMKSLDTLKEGYGNFYMQPNGVFLIEKDGLASVVKTADVYGMERDIDFATQSGPMLVVDGAINKLFSKNAKSKHIRNGVGVDELGQMIFVISNKRVNLYSFASIFRDYFHCKNALYLDGAISRMFLPELNRNQLGGDFGPLIGVVK